MKDNNNGETTLETLIRLVRDGFERVEKRLDTQDIELHEIHGIVANHRLDLDNLLHRVKKLEEEVFPNAR